MSPTFTGTANSSAAWMVLDVNRLRPQGTLRRVVERGVFKSMQKGPCCCTERNFFSIWTEKQEGTIFSRSFKCPSCWQSQQQKYLSCIKNAHIIFRAHQSHLWKSNTFQAIKQVSTTYKELIDHNKIKSESITQR